MNLSTSTGSGHASGPGGKVFLAGGSSDEDPYSVAGSGSSGSSGNNGRSRSRDKPPKLPPRDNALYAPSIWAKTTESKKDRDRRGGKTMLSSFSYIIVLQLRHHCQM